MPEGLSPNDPAELRLTKLRVDIDIQIDALEVHLGLMRGYRYLGDDEGLSRATAETRDRMRGVLALVARLDQEKQNAETSSRAAIEFRNARDRKRA